MYICVYVFDIMYIFNYIYVFMWHDSKTFDLTKKASFQYLYIANK